ncbi:MAG TPA: hypothetical protein VJV74_08785, partial [Terriglobia bacterium]|nr:hypothetical protein [Terriglobia bacterium]
MARAVNKGVKMRRDRLRWTAWGIAILTFLLTLAAPASAQSAQSNAGQPAPNQQDISDLQRAREYITRNQLDEAKGICDRLANKGGTVGAQAQDCLTQVNARSACEQDAQRLLDLSKQRVCQQAAELLQAIRQRCPDFTGLLTLDATVTRCVPLPPPPSSPVLQAGIELYNNRQYRQALSFFESKRSTDPNLPELEGWIEKTKEQLKTARQKLATEE